VITRSIQQAVLSFPVARWAVALALLSRGGIYLAAGRLYRGLDDIAWVARGSNAGWLKRIALRVVFGVVGAIRRSGRRHPVIESFHDDAASTALAASYSLYGGPHELLRDLIVLKRATPDEKGVVLLKYVRTFDAVVSMFDLERLMERYLFVLEPCWAGYCDPSLLMFMVPGQPVIVQCFTAEDYDFVAAAGAPLVPVRLGPADWVDADLFKPRQVEAKTHDLVMVANWAPHKRHAQLFRALRQITDRDLRVLLIGFPWAGRTASDIRREAAAIANPRVRVEIVEKLPASEVADRVSRCKAFVFLSRKEGDNKALVEAMFADVPAIVYDKTIGGASSRINPATGIFASDEELADKIRQMLDTHATFTPRAWAVQNSGSAIATRVLSEAIRRTVEGSGGRYTEEIVEKTNSPNLAYKDPAVRARFQGDYDFILSCRRFEHQVSREAVA
jgi:glycosyltransferase involved in cell wall biosynthesis